MALLDPNESLVLILSSNDIAYNRNNGCEIETDFHILI